MKFRSVKCRSTVTEVYNIFRGVISYIYVLVLSWITLTRHRYVCKYTKFNTNLLHHVLSFVNYVSALTVDHLEGARKIFSQHLMPKHVGGLINKRQTWCNKLALNFIYVIKLQGKCTTLNLQMPNMHKLPTTLIRQKFLTNNAAIYPTVFKAETCGSIN
jgi:hypothetical protein